MLPIIFCPLQFIASFPMFSKTTLRND
uniref:Uncharacterized protein n=1 Tax=Rhizophora mucronata TaxID=61149 RepID=A0A2P2PUL4_RHIMU